MRPKFREIVSPFHRQGDCIPSAAKRSAQVKGFEVIPKRWVVERTIAWINRCRRLAKDYENLNRTAIAFIRLASIRLMLRRLTRYCYPS